jgi:hypothetical protein
MKRGSMFKLALIALIASVLILAVYFSFFFSPRCTNYDCFNFYLEKCRRAELFYEKEDTTWFYSIQGKSEGACFVEVKLLQVKQGKLDIEKLRGQSMVCSLPSGSVDSPERDIAQCHGLLKEGLQELIILRLHNYIVTNLGEISSALYNIESPANQSNINPSR